MSVSRTWLVTGASRGIGLNIVQQLLHSPENVVFAACRNPSSAVALNALKNAPETKGKLHVVEMDVTDQESISRAMSEVKGILGDAGIDYLLNNAGIAFKDDTPSTLNPKDLIASVTANVVGPTLVTRTFMPLIESGNRKIIVNTSSSLSSISKDLGGQHASYSVSKAALNMLTYKQVKERPDLVPFLIDPGWVKTDMGGEDATLEPHESAAGIVTVVSNANQSFAGHLYNHKGEKIPW